mgnify:CR=1 FL=1
MLGHLFAGERTTKDNDPPLVLPALERQLAILPLPALARIRPVGFVTEAPDMPLDVLGQPEREQIGLLTLFRRRALVVMCEWHRCPDRMDSIHVPRTSATDGAFRLPYVSGQPASHCDHSPVRCRNWLK